jgi:hypothetical protein
MMNGIGRQMDNYGYPPLLQIVLKQSVLDFSKRHSLSSFLAASRAFDKERFFMYSLGKL